MARARFALSGGNRRAAEHNMFDFRGVAGNTGNIFFVDSGAASAGTGRSPDSPKLTIDSAINLCTADNGDVIIVAEGHAETITLASSIALDVAGVTVIGLGVGSNRPTITYGTNTTATTVVSAANVKIKNLRFLCNVDSLAVFLTLGADDAVVEDCDFIGQSTKEVVNAIGITTTKDNAVIRRCRFIQGTDPGGTNGNAGTGAVYLVDSENVLVEDCEFRGSWETAFIHNKTTGAANLWVKRCYGICSLADAVPFVLASGATGGADRCSFITPAETQVTEASLSGTFTAGFFNFESYFGNDGGGGQLAVASQSAAM